MHDPTYETFYREECDLATERQEEIKQLCWQECANCRGRGYFVAHWESDDGGPDYTTLLACMACDGEGHIQIHDPLIVSELLDAAECLRQKCGIWCYTRIAAGLSLAIEGAVGPDFKTVKSASVKDREYHICLDDAIVTMPESEHRRSTISPTATIILLRN